MSDVRHIIEQLRRQLAGGNALSANAIAMAALEDGHNDRELRYLYLRSLADTGSTRLALKKFATLAPAPEERNEDWLALPARLHKDLAFAGESVLDNLNRAAAQYESVYALTGGTFPAVNAATLHLLAGRPAHARTLALQVLSDLTKQPPNNEIEQYYWFATQAEAELVLGNSDACIKALRVADPLCRNDLLTRSRTRQQIARILRHHALDESIVDVLKLPWAYVVDFEDSAHEGSPAIPAALWQTLEGSPVFTPLTTSSMSISVAEAVLRTGARLHLVAAEEQGSMLRQLRESGHEDLAKRAETVIARSELFTPLRGFLKSEPEWHRHQQQRQVHGIAAIMAGRFASGVRRLHLLDESWQVAEHRPPPQKFRPSKNRRMVGLVFSDMVGFSQLDDEEIHQYWTHFLPELDRALTPFDKGILLRRTWGDALHIATADASTAAEMCLAMVQATNRLRPKLTGRLAQLELRIGAHFAPAFSDIDAIEKRGTFFGSQLSFAARVEPVTPPGTTFISESLCAELELETPGRFRVEYVGEIALAKRYGSFRLYNLVARRER